MLLQEITKKTNVKSWRIETLKLGKALDILNSQFRDGLRAISDGNVIWRGADANPRVITFIEPSTGFRLSKDTNGAYQMLMDASSALEGWPKRSSSAIGSISPGTAGSYNRNLGALIPVDGAKIAVSRYPDFMARERLGYFSIQFRRVYEGMCAYAGIKPISGDFSLQQFKTVSKHVDAFYDKVLADSGGDPAVANHKMFKDLFELIEPGVRERIVNVFGGTVPFHSRIFAMKSGRLQFLADSLFTPKELHLKLLPASKIPAKVGQRKKAPEVWTDARCAFIPFELFIPIVAELIKNGHPVHKSYADLAKTEKDYTTRFDPDKNK